MLNESMLGRPTGRSAASSAVRKPAEMNASRTGLLYERANAATFSGLGAESFQREMLAGDMPTLCAISTWDAAPVVLRTYCHHVMPVTLVALTQ